MRAQYGTHNYILKDINKIDKIQRQAARFAKNNYLWSTSVTSLINDLNWQNLQTRRSNLKLILMFKITHNLVSIPKVTISFHAPLVHITIAPPTNYHTLE